MEQCPGCAVAFQGGFAVSVACFLALQLQTELVLAGYWGRGKRVNRIKKAELGSRGSHSITSNESCHLSGIRLSAWPAHSFLIGKSYVRSQLLITRLFLGNEIKRRHSQSDSLMRELRGPRAGTAPVDEFPGGLGWTPSNNPTCAHPHSLYLLPYPLISFLCPSSPLSPKPCPRPYSALN